HTWSNGRGVFRRLDYIFTTLQGSVCAEKITPVWFSDHLLISVELISDALGSRANYWKLNTKVLLEADYRSLIVALLESFQTRRWRFPTAVSWWEACKKAVARDSIKYCRHKRVAERRELSEWQRELEELYVIFNRGGSFDAERAAAIKLRLKNFWSERAKDFLFRLKGTLLEGEEKCTAQFFGSVRARQTRTHFEGLRQKDGAITRDNEGMLRCASEFYRALFSEKPVDKGRWEEWLAGLERKTVDIVSLEARLTVVEIREAMAGLRKGTAPGFDGLPIEFYITFWDLLQPMLIEVYEEILRVGDLGRTMRTGVLSLIYKKGEKEDLDNWRPIQLLCTDYKILARALGRRLRKVMPDLVGRDQTCSVEGRKISCFSIGSNRGYLFYPGQPLTCKRCLQGTDMQCCGEKVIWDILQRTVQGDSAGGVVWQVTRSKTVNKEICICSKLVGGVQESGVQRIRLILSDFYRELFSEKTVNAVLWDELLSGVGSSGGTQAKIAAYADDVTLLLTSDRSLLHVLQIAGKMKEGTGALLNKSKCTVKYFGKWKDRQDVVGGLTLESGPIKILGVSFLSSGSAIFNWENKLSKVKQKLGLWQSRPLTYVGKVLVVKVDVLPLLLHLAGVFPLPPRFRKDLVRAIFRFIWGGGYEYVKRVDMCRPVE
uniref:Reverse transcriptase domain-containing protein n=1 Tax=Lepisosteus oculatus TaxID=7918 RepID=W5LWT1_LEPOC